MDLDSFKVDAVMVHDIPRGNDEAEQLTLTDEPIELDDDLRSYFRRKIVASSMSAASKSSPTRTRTTRLAQPSLG